MKVLNGTNAPLQTAHQSPHSRRAMAVMGGVFAFTALAALAMALLLEGPAVDAGLPDSKAAAAAPAAAPR